MPCMQSCVSSTDLSSRQSQHTQRALQEISCTMAAEAHACSASEPEGISRAKWQPARLCKVCNTSAVWQEPPASPFEAAACSPLPGLQPAASSLESSQSPVSLQQCGSFSLTTPWHLDHLVAGRNSGCALSTPAADQGCGMQCYGSAATVRLVPYLSPYAAAQALTTRLCLAAERDSIDGALQPQE